MSAGTSPSPRVLMTLDAVGGVWRYALDLAAGLGKIGCEVILAGFGPEPDTRQRREAEAVAALDWASAPLDWMARDEAALADVPGEIARLARRHRADLLHLNLPSQAAGLETDLPVVAVSHSCTPTWFAAVRGTGLPQGWEWQGRLSRAGLSRADAIVAPSAAHADLMRAIHGPLPRLEVVRNGCRAPLRAGGSGRGVLAMGRWWDDGKGGATLDAAAKGAAWPVVMLGALRGENGAELAIRHAQAPGAVPHTEAMAHLARAGIFVAPSIYEPFGLAVAEAARAKLPLILSDIPTFRELWDGAALFFTPRDAEALRAAMDRLASNPALRRRLGAAARKRSIAYTVAAQVQGMQAIYARLASATPVRERAVSTR